MTALSHLAVIALNQWDSEAFGSPDRDVLRRCGSLSDHLFNTYSAFVHMVIAFIGRAAQPSLAVWSEAQPFHNDCTRYVVGVQLDRVSNPVL